MDPFLNHSGLATIRKLSRRGTVFELTFDPLLANEAASFGYMIAGAEDYNTGQHQDPAALGLSAPDDRTFVIRLVHPSSFLLRLLATGTPFLPIYQPAVEKFDGVHRRASGWTQAGALIGRKPS